MTLVLERKRAERNKAAGKVPPEFGQLVLDARRDGGEGAACGKAVALQRTERNGELLLRYALDSMDVVRSGVALAFGRVAGRVLFEGYPTTDGGRNGSASV